MIKNNDTFSDGRIEWFRAMARHARLDFKSKSSVVPPPTLEDVITTKQKCSKDFGAATHELFRLFF
jgi:hypothetical protein